MSSIDAITSPEIEPLINQPSVLHEAPMPDNRFLSPRLGQSRKVSALTDFEARVWSHGYLLCSDDYGVMLYSAAIIRGFNRRLAHATDELVVAALAKIVEVGLLLDFEHQEERYLCDPMWQNYQMVRWPRQTVCPCPPAEILLKCSGETLQLFRSKHGEFPKNFRSTSEKLNTRQGGRAQANANANAEAKGGSEGGAFTRFWAAYPKKVGKDRAAEEWRRKGCEAQTDIILAALDLQSGYLLRDGGKYIPNPATWLHQGRWKDDPPTIKIGAERSRLNDAWVDRKAGDHAL